MKVIRFAEPWKTRSAKGDSVILTAPELVVRHPSGAAGSELLIAATAADGTMSDDVYAFGLEGKFSVRRADPAAWQMGGTLAAGKTISLSHDTSSLSADGITYGGRKFPKTGAFWSEPVGLVSGNQKWLAVFSYNSDEGPAKNPPDLSKFIGGAEPGKGVLFVDVYDLSSGERILHGESTFSGAGPSLFFSHAQWADDCFFIMPLDTLSQSAFLGIGSEACNRR